jgi:hypothetical protein
MAKVGWLVVVVMCAALSLLSTSGVEGQRETQP